HGIPRAGQPWGCHRYLSGLVAIFPEDENEFHMDCRSIGPGCSAGGCFCTHGELFQFGDYRTTEHLTLGSSICTRRWGCEPPGTVVRSDRLRDYFSDFMVDVPKEFETESGLFVWDIFSFTIRCPLCSGVFQRKPRSI